MKKIIYFSCILIVVCSLIIIAGCEKNSSQYEKSIPYESSVQSFGIGLNIETSDISTQQYINVSDIEWLTMQGGLHITTKVLFPGHDNDKINKIVKMINSGTDKTESTQTEINVIHSKARPVSICFQLKNGNKIYIWPDYTTKTFKNGWSAAPVNDKFILNLEDNVSDKYYTVLSKDVAEYLREGWKADMPIVEEVTVKSENGKAGEKVIIRDGDKVIVSGDGSTAREVVIHIRRNNNLEEDYIVGKVIPEFGEWEWEEVIKKQLMLDGREIILANDLYDIVVDTGEGQTGLSEVIDLRK